jgi:hypothetical protein
MVNFNKMLASLKDASKAVRNSIVVYSIINLAIAYLVFAKLNTIATTISENLYFLFVALFCSITILTILAGAFYKLPLSGIKRLVFDLAGLVFSLSLIAPLNDVIKVAVLCTAGPVSLGLYIPRILTLVIDGTKFENRGSVAGLFTFLVFMLVILVSPLVTGVFELALMVFALKILTIFLKDEKILRVYEEEYNPMPINIRAYFLFIWLIFVFVDYFSVVAFAYLVPRTELILLNSATILTGLFSMVIGGVIFDYFGRKKMLLFSYAYLGLIYAFISLSGGGLIRISFVEGIAWGVLTPLFILILWGDICKPKERPIYVGISVILSFSSTLFELFGTSTYIGILEFFPLVSTLLFLATFIILFLPETLPDRVLQKREMEEYLQKAKEIREHYR